MGASDHMRWWTYQVENSEFCSLLNLDRLPQAWRLGRFSLVDLAISGGIEGTEQLIQRLLSYDVGCGLIANMLLRWEDWSLSAEMLPIIQQLKIVLPQLHMLAHKESCQTEYAMCYKEGTGHSNGEMVETLWAEHNMVGLSTREMNGGARHDALNDFFNSWNWFKTETRGDSLC